MRSDGNYTQFEDDAIPIKRRQVKEPRQRAIPYAAPARRASAAENPKYGSIPVAKPANSERPVFAAQRVGVAKDERAVRNSVRAARVAPDIPAGRNAVRAAGSVASRKTAAPVQSTSLKRAQEVPPKKKEIRSVYSEFAKPKKKKIYRRALLIYLGVLLLASIVVLLMVRSNLRNFNTHDIEYCLYEKTEAIKKAAAKGNIKSEIEFDDEILSSVQSENVLTNFERAVANGNLDYKKNQKSSSETGNSVYDLSLNGFRVGSIEYKLVKESTLALLPPFINLPLTEWELVSCKAEVLSFELPSSCALYQGDTLIEGIPSENEGFLTYYFTDNMTITDSIGNRAELNAGNKIDLNEYTAKIRSDYKLYYGDTLIDPSKAVEKTIDDAEITVPGINLDMATVREYASSFPTMSVYNLFILDKGESLSVKSADGSDVEFKQNGNAVKAYAIDLEYSDNLPAGLAGNPDPLKIAETWSLFMSQDLTGPSNGFATLAQYLVKDSYLYDSMWQYANSIDITFTSDHTLDNPAFPVEKMSDFVKFSDTFFACNIELEKPMNLSDGQRIIDTFDSTFYFVYVDDTEDGVDNPHWAAAARYDR